MGSDIRPFGDSGVSTESEAVRHFRDAVLSGKHWYIALLESIGLWTTIQESYNDRDYRYLISGEAFDWLLLAERILDEVGNLVPEEEVIDLLFHGKPPIELTDEEFCSLIGDAKYHAHLNFFYGVVIEEALLMAVEQEAQKEQRTSPFSENGSATDEPYQRIYGSPLNELLNGFRKEKNCPRLNSMGLNEAKEFTYWLFKYRLNNCDKARIASDTKKALKELGRQRGRGGEQQEPT